MTLSSSPAARSAPRVFYGWLIVLIAYFSSFITAGAGLYVFGQFITPLSQTFGWSVGQVSLATTVRSLTSVAIAPFIGRLTDRLGSRPVMAAGVLVAGVSWSALYVVNDPTLFYIVFSVCIGLGFNLLSGIPSQAAVARWFRRRRGMALALTSVGVSTGGVVMVPLVQYLLGAVGWRMTFLLIGVGLVILMLPLVLLFMRDYPEQMGLHPDGDAPAADGPAPTAGPVHDDRIWTTAEVMRSSMFWQQAVGYMFASALLQTLQVYQYPFIVSRGFDGTMAASIVSLYALAAGASKFGWGYFADRADPRKLAVTGIWLAGIGMSILMFATDTPVLWLYAIVGGAGIGGLASMQPTVTALSFGRRSYGTVVGLLNPMNQMAAALAVPFVGFLYDGTRSYNLGFTLVIVVALATCLSLLRLPKIEHARRAAGSA
ncbi:MAG: MFS transporter [Chloroflexi bacterium]|nr:MFS transporter [Chloroflexota bacterium]